MRRKNLDRCEARYELFDAKLGILDERMSGHWTLDDERWRSHDRTHVELARNLVDYKRESNEWRGTVSDIRSSFLLKSEYMANHDGLRSELLAETKPISARLAVVETWQLARDARERGVTSTLSAQRGVLLVVGSIIGTILGVAALASLIATVTT
jgi:hypothetical protein